MSVCRLRTLLYNLGLRCGRTVFPRQVLQAIPVFGHKFKPNPSQKSNKRLIFYPSFFSVSICIFFVKKNAGNVTYMETFDYICTNEWNCFSNSPRFKVVYSKEAIAFLDALEIRAREKVLLDINKSKYIIDSDGFKKLVGTNFWEFRTSFNRKQYRMISFWDREGEALVIATNGFVKKSQKIPTREIRKAERIRDLYYSSKR